MWKIAFLLLLAICLQVTLAGRHEADDHHGNRRGGKGSGKWGEKEGEEGEEGDYGRQWDSKKMDEKKMMMMRFMKMMKPMRRFFTKVLALGPVHHLPEQPEFCEDNECPKFEVRSKTEHYELRCYQPSKWISVTMEGKSSEALKQSMFWPMFRYISGNNDQKQKIKMTVPVTTVIKPTLENTTSYTMSFYIPKSHQANPPTPRDNKIKVIDHPKSCYWVHSFGGWANERKNRMEVKMLEKLLKKDGHNGHFVPHKKLYITAGYDDPMKMFERHNEVMLKWVKH